MHYSRLINLPKNRHFFLFGARNTGKSTLIRELFDEQSSITINLLLPEIEEHFARHPEELIAQVNALPPEKTHVVIDEVQKLPKLLDVIHQLIESTQKKFVMTGSSARKLKYGGANLLAGRAFVYSLYPFSYLELKDDFNLDKMLQWGGLPDAVLLKDDDEKSHFLRAYARTYLKEEIWSEQLIRNLDPFRRFLEVAAQCNAKIINFANIARDVGVNDKTIRQYFSILEDTLIGFFLEPYLNSFRKRLSRKPKFYFFDMGVVRALNRTLSIPVKPQTNTYGESFEHYIILECIKLASYYQPEYRFSYLRTKDDAEIDLIVERPGLPLLCIEIKSATEITQMQLTSFMKLTADIESAEAVCLANIKVAKRYDHVSVFPWQEGVERLFVKRD